MSRVLTPSDPAFWGSTPGAAGNTDPYFANVQLLLHAEGANNSTTFTDSSSFARTVTVSGTGKISTDQYKFGSSSMVFPGGTSINNGGRVSLDSYSGDFTIECWFRANDFAASGYLFGSTNSNQPNCWLSNSEVLSFRYGAATSTTTITANIGQWYYVAMVRTGSTTYLYVDGTRYTYGGTTPTTGTWGNPLFGIGNLGNANSNFNGYIDELRVTTVARYTGSSMTVPDGPFPDS